jgi:hypothetical protein
MFSIYSLRAPSGYKGKCGKPVGNKEKRFHGVILDWFVVIERAFMFDAIFFLRNVLHEIKVLISTTDLLIIRPLRTLRHKIEGWLKFLPAIPSNKTLVLPDGNAQRSVYGINVFPVRSLRIPNSKDDFRSIRGWVPCFPRSVALSRGRRIEN